MGNLEPTSDDSWTPPSIEQLHQLLPQYEISRLLGLGGMGAVYEGVQSNLDRKVAIKILPETLADDSDGLNFAERFTLEAKSMANLDHPGILSIYDFGQTSGGQLYFVMEFVDGMDIHQYLDYHGGKLPQDSAVAITCHVLDALGYAHGCGIVHRDIKPANIMIRSDGRVKVADFGLVKRLSETGEGSPDSALTVSNVALGTPDYVAPESIEIGRLVDHRADIYSIGVMLYQLLTGAVPRGSFKPPSELIDGIDKRLDSIVLRAMQTDPEDRFATAEEFRIAIDEILSSPIPEEQHTAPIAPEKRSSSQPVQEGRLHRLNKSAPQKSRKPVVLAAAIGVPIVLLATLLLWFGKRDTVEQDLSVEANLTLLDTTPLQPNAPTVPDQPADPAPSIPSLSFGTYPANLEIPIPESLRETAREGGRLEFLKTKDIPSEFLPIFEMGDAAKFDDFVEVYRSNYGWMAVRKNGDVWGLGWDAGFEQFTGFGPIRVKQIARGFNPLMIDENGQVQSLLGFGEPVVSTGMEEMKDAIGYGNSRGLLHVFLGSSNEILKIRNSFDESIPPPSDFFQNATVIGTSARSFLVSAAGEPLRGWDWQAGGNVPLEDPPSEIVEIVGGGTQFALLTAVGSVHVIHATTGIANPVGSKPPENLRPAFRVRNSACILAQHEDGTWTAWQNTPLKESEDRSELISLISDLGPALDTDTGAIRRPGEEIAGFWAIVIRPRNTAETTTITQVEPSRIPEPASVPSTEPSESEKPETETAEKTARPPLPDIFSSLAEAKEYGGKLKTWGYGRGNTPPNLGPAGDFSDFVQVSVNGSGWAARRRDGTAHLTAWGRTNGQYNGSGVFIDPFPSSFMLRGRSVTLRELPSGNFRNIYSGGSQTRTEWAHPDAVAIVNPNNHLTSIDAAGKILLSQPWGNGSTLSGPPEDFFLGTTKYTASADHYISARSDLPVRAWNVQGGALSKFPDEINSITQIDAASNFVTLLSASGEIHVRDPSGAPLISDLGFLEPPEDLPPAVAVRAGLNMCAAQTADGYWTAWGQSADLIEKVRTLGPALDLDLHYQEDESEFLIWIEPLSQFRPDAPSLTTTLPSGLPADVLERLAEIDEQFKTAYDRDIAPGHTKAVASLDKNYLAAVKRALNKASKSGDLDSSVQLRDEVQRLEAKLPLPPLDLDSLPESLRSLRKTYRETFAGLEADRLEKSKPYQDRLDELYDEYQIELTKGGRLDDALAVKAWREKKALSIKPAPIAAPEEPTVSLPPATPEDLQPFFDWIFRIKGSLVVRKDGKEITAREPSELPAHPFEITQAWATSSETNDTNDKDLALLRNFNSLERLTLVSSQMEFKSLAPISQHTSLVYLEIRSVNIALPEEELSHLAGLTKLKQLAIRFEETTGESLVHLRSAKDLNTLWLLSSKPGSLTELGVQAIAQLPSLASLRLHELVGERNQEALASLASLKHLKILFLESCSLKPEGFSHIAKIEGLETLSLNNCEIDNRGFGFLAPLAPSLTDLDMQNGATVSDKGIETIVATLPNLEFVSASNGSTCTKKSLVELAKLPKLKKIFWWVKDMEPADYRLLANFPALESLHLGYHATITDDEIEVLTQLPKLAFLDITLPQITDKALPHLQAIKPLENLNLGNTQVTPEGIAAFKKARPEVRINY